MAAAKEENKTEKIVMEPTPAGKKKGFPAGALNKDGKLVVNPVTAGKLETAGLAKRVK